MLLLLSIRVACKVYGGLFLIPTISKLAQHIGPIDGEIGTCKNLCFASSNCCADILEAVAEEEGQMDLDVDQEIEAFMAAEAMEGRPTSIITEFVIKMLGLEICGNTEVGNALRPACSPGQKKRVTVGESPTLSCTGRVQNTFDLLCQNTVM